MAYRRTDWAKGNCSDQIFHRESIDQDIAKREKQHGDSYLVQKLGNYLDPMVACQAVANNQMGDNDIVLGKTAIMLGQEYANTKVERDLQ